MAGATNRRSQSPTILVATEAAMTLPSETERPIVSDNAFALIVYVLYCLGYFTVISALIGVIIPISLRRAVRYATWFFDTIWARFYRDCIQQLV
jgi:uncharacterized membrane protein